MSVNYKRLKKGELVEKCVQAGINHNSKSKRNDLIQLLIENDLQKNNQQLELQLDINTSPKDCHCCSRENNEDGDNNILNLDIPIFNNQESNSEDNGEENGGENGVENGEPNNSPQNNISINLSSKKDDNSNEPGEEFTNLQEMNKLTNLLQLIGLKNILEQSNTSNTSNASNASDGEDTIKNKDDSTLKEDSFTLGNSNEILSTLFYFLSADFKKKILEKEEDWSQKKKIQDWEQYQLDKIQMITQRPCLPTEDRFHLETGELVNIETQMIKQQDDFFEYTEHFLTKQDMMEKTFYYTSKFESDAGGQAIRCMREAYQLLKYQLQFLLNRWTKHQQQLSENPDIQPQPLKEIYFINIIHGDVAEHYVKNLLYLKNQEKFKNISQFVMIGDLTYFALYWIQYHRENFVSWEKYQLLNTK